MGKPKTVQKHFTSLPLKDVPRGRRGKHKLIVSRILSDLDQLAPGSAMKVPLSDLAESKARVRSAINRATRNRGRIVSTASDDHFLYIWNEEEA